MEVIGSCCKLLRHKFSIDGKIHLGIPVIRCIKAQFALYAAIMLSLFKSVANTTVRDLRWFVQKLHNDYHDQSLAQRDNLWQVLLKISIHKKLAAGSVVVGSG